jgi:hypothetical protein
LRAATSARLPWPTALVSIDYHSYLNETTPGGLEARMGGTENVPSDMPILITSDDSGCRGRASIMGQLKITQTEKFVGLTVEPIGVSFDFSGETPAQGSARCTALVAAAMKTDVDRILKDADANFATKPQPVSEQVRQIINGIMRDRPSSDVWLLGSSFLPPLITMRDAQSRDFEGSVEDRQVWLRDLQAETDALAAVGRMLACSWSAYASPQDFNGSEGWNDEMLVDPIFESRGTGRLLLAIMAILGESGATVIETTRTGGSKMVGHRRLPLMTQSHVRIDLSRLSILRSVSDDRDGPARGVRVEHNVRGHWAHYLRNGSPSCAHVWTPDGEAGKRQRCACGGLRVWRSTHVRGSATKGYAFTSPVAVTA